jgi:magnesium transporter
MMWKWFKNFVQNNLWHHPDSLMDCQQYLQELHKSKRDLIYLRKYIWPLREVISSLSKGDSLNLEGNTAIYLRDVYDHCIHVIDTLETFREVSSCLMDVYISSISN